MKNRILLLLLTLYFPFFYCQNLANILEGYTISSLPTSKSIVGSKWVKGIGATTEGLPEDKLVIAESLALLSLNKNNEINIGAALISVLGLSGYNSSDIKVIINKLDVYTVKNLYELPLAQGEAFVFSSIKAESFDLEFDSKLSSAVDAKIMYANLPFRLSSSTDHRKRLTIEGSNLFVAHKIVKLDKVDERRKSKKMRSSFEVKDIMGYDIKMNVSPLVNNAIVRTKNELGINQYNSLKYLDSYIRKFSKEKQIIVDVLSAKQGLLSSGIFNKKFDVCYCEVIGRNTLLYPINFVNTGDKVTYYYLYIDQLHIQYKFFDGVSTLDNERVAFLTTSDESKLSIISKTFYISSIN